jgi:hypothetical protein
MASVTVMTGLLSYIQMVRSTGSGMASGTGMTGLLSYFRMVGSTGTGMASDINRLRI